MEGKWRGSGKCKCTRSAERRQPARLIPRPSQAALASASRPAAMKWCARFLEVMEEMAWVAMSVEEISRHFCASSTILSPSCEKLKRRNSLLLLM